MIFFTLIFFAMVITVGLSTVLGFAFYLKRRTRLSQNSRPPEELPPYRSLFEPDEDDLRLLASQSRARAESDSRAAEERVVSEKIEKTRQFIAAWQNQPNNTNTIKLLHLAAISESAQLFSEIAQNVVEKWQNGEIEDLTAENLADLLDSHLRILPQQESASGALFWLKQKILSLRKKSEDVD